MKTKIRTSLSFVAVVLLPLAVCHSQTSEFPPGKDRAEIGHRLAEYYGATDPRYVVNEAKTGDTASGVEVLRTSRALSINTQPCSQPGNVITFVKPFREEPISDEVCNGKTVHRLQVVQTAAH